MSSNLPPGVTTSMLPGNRPEDEWLDHFWDELSPPDYLYEMHPVEAAQLVNRLLAEVGEIFVTGFNVGKAETETEIYSRLAEETAALNDS